MYQDTIMQILGKHLLAIGMNYDSQGFSIPKIEHATKNYEKNSEGAQVWKKQKNTLARFENIL